MRKIFLLSLALLASFSLWADISYYTPTADEVIILSGVYDKDATSAGYSTHAGIKFYSASVSFSSKNAGDPDNNGASKSGLSCFSSKNNGDAKRVDLNISGVDSIIIYRESNNISRYVRLLATPAGESQTTITGTTATSSYLAHGYSLDPNKSYSIRLEGWDGSSQQDVYVYAIKLFKGTTCSDPAEELALNLSKTTDIYVGDVITAGHTGGNGSTVSYTLDGAPFNAASWTATEGEHTFAISQDAAEVESVLTCGGSDEVVLNVVAAEAVEEVSIAGATSAYVGAELTYEATAANATAYEWYLDGLKQGSDSAKFIYTAVKGSHSIVCRARNQFNVDPYPEWIASDPIALTVTNPSGTLIAATAETSGSNIDKNITATGIIGGTVHQKTDKNGKIGSNGYYFSLQLTTGSFLAGDTVRVISSTSYAIMHLFSDEGSTSIAEKASPALNDYVVLAGTVSKIYLYRNSTDGKNMNPTVTSISVIRPKEVKSVTETLSNVKIDGEAISSDNLTTLLTDESLDIAESYLDAPEVKFYKNIRTTFEDDTYSDKLDSIVVTSTTEAGKWQAQATINEVEYTVTMAKTASFVVTYMFGSTELGTENVVTNGNPANYATYQTLNDGNLSTFGGWYSKSDLSGDAVTIAYAPITKDTTFYASFTYKYATSVNMENFAKNNAKGETNSEALISSLGTNKYASNISYVSGTNEIDSLRADKITGDRNYPYLGLKVKTSGALINFRLEEGKTVMVKFGNVGATPLVSINGGEYAAMTITNSVYTYTATVDGELVSIKTASAAAVVFQQIAIDEELANPELFAVTCAAAENGTVTSNRQLGIPGETVTLTLTPTDGYKVASVTVNGGDPLAVSENTATFTMPAAAVTVSATFSLATALDNTDVNTKAVKRLENGILVIEKNGVRYNVTGQVIK